jgi:hypothetical protein
MEFVRGNRTDSQREDEDMTRETEKKDFSKADDLAAQSGTLRYYITSHNLHLPKAAIICPGAAFFTSVMAIHFPPVAFIFSCEGANILLENAARMRWRTDFGIISRCGLIASVHTRQNLKLFFRQ